MGPEVNIKDDVNIFGLILIRYTLCWYTWSDRAASSVQQQQASIQTHIVLDLCS